MTDIPPLQFQWDGEDIQTLKSLLAYDAASGVFTWRARSPHMFSAKSKRPEHEAAIWNAKYATKPAGRLNTSTGYVEIAILGRRYQAHRLAILISTGTLPEEVDHINGIRTDNARVNLRETTHQMNCHNLTSKGASRFVGVSFDGSKKKWQASLTFKGQRHHLGRFQTEAEAAAAYAAKKSALLGFPWSDRNA